jgi:hypothetical protein
MTVLERAPVDVDDELPTCRVCGCDDSHACEGGCWWVADDLCSACEGV